MKYVADDGTIFDNESCCLAYEEEQERKSKALELQKQYKAEQSNMVIYDINFVNNDPIKLLIHSQSNHRDIALMIATQLYGCPITFANRVPAGEAIQSVYNVLKSSSDSNIEEKVSAVVSDRTAIIFEANDVPHVFDIEKISADILVYSYSGFTSERVRLNSEQLDASMKQYSKEQYSKEQENKSKEETSEEKDLEEDFCEWFTRLLNEIVYK